VEGVFGSTFSQVPFLVVAFALGVTAQGVKICVDTIVQQEVDDAYLGRVFSLYDMLFNTAYVLGPAIAAAFMPTNGKSYALVIAIAVGYLLAAAAYGMLSRRAATYGRPAPDSSSGPGGAPHLAGELFKSMAKVNLVHVPYKGSAPSFQDLLGGQVSLTCDSLVQALPYIRDKRLIALAVLGTARSPLLPEVPTVAESLPGYELTNWFGLVAPAAVPRAIVGKIHTDVIKVLQDPGVSEKLSAMGATAVGNTPEQFGAVMRADSEKWAKLIREANIRAE